MQKTIRVRNLSTIIDDAAQTAMTAYAERRIVEEPQITDRILGAIEGSLDGRVIGGVRWSAKTLRTGRGEAAEEKEFGADLLGVLDIQLPGTSVSKGFLAQAKRLEPGEGFSGSDWERLRGQCEKMLAVTDDAFVMLYSLGEGIRLVPATAVLGSSNRDLFGQYDRSLKAFIELFIECFVGDRSLNGPNTAVLDAARQARARRELVLSARPADLPQGSARQ